MYSQSYPWIWSHFSSHLLLGIFNSSLRSKRFRGVWKQRKTDERDLRRSVCVENGARAKKKKEGVGEVSFLPSPPPPPSFTRSIFRAVIICSLTPQKRVLRRLHHNNHVISPSEFSSNTCPKWWAIVSAFLYFSGVVRTGPQWSVFIAHAPRECSGCWTRALFSFISWWANFKFKLFCH